MVKFHPPFHILKSNIFLICSLISDIAAINRANGLEIAANTFTTAVNAVGATPEERLQHSFVRVGEIAHHDVNHGVVQDMTATSAQLDQDLTLMDPGFPADFNKAAFPNAITGFAQHAQAIVNLTPAQDIIQKVFGDEDNDE